MRHRPRSGRQGKALLLMLLFVGVARGQQPNDPMATLHGATVPTGVAPLSEVVDGAGLLGIGVASVAAPVPFALLQGPLNPGAAVVLGGSVDVGTWPHFADVTVLINGVNPTRPWDILGVIPPNGVRGLVVPVPAANGSTVGTFQAVVLTPTAGTLMRLTAALEVTTVQGSVHALSDDDWVEVQLPNMFPFFGAAYTSAFICSNGFVTFGAPDVSYQESVNGLLTGPPRVAGLWEDLDPFTGGTVRECYADGWWRVAWQDVPLFGGSQTVSFEVRFHLGQGDLAFVYGAMENTGGLVGFGPGSSGPGSQVAPSDFSSGGQLTQPGDTAAEIFGGFHPAFDLQDYVLVFEAMNSTASSFRSLN